MFVTFLKFAGNRAAAPDYLAAHSDWLARGFAGGAFLCAGTLIPAAGGAILAHDARIATDPSVVQSVVVAETREIDPKKTAPALDFLKVSA